MRALDTNAVVRLIMEDDPDQAGVEKDFIAGGAWISHLVLAETVWVLESAYERTASQIIRAVEMLLDHKDLTVQEGDVAAAALRQFRSRPALGFSDCLVLEIARKAGHLPLGTFDRDLAKVDGAQRLR
jgi:predicted nucleic-acid-binding protein